MNADEVLDVLMQNQEVLGWLANDGRQHMADARLTVFRSDEHFAVFTEFSHFLYGAESFYHWVGCAGDCLMTKERPLFSRELSIHEVPDAPLWRTDEYVHWLADRARFSVAVNEQRFDFKPSTADYARAGIEFEIELSGPNSISPGELLRLLCVEFGHAFFHSEGELRELIDPTVSAKMSLFLQTDWWQHPGFLVDGDAPDFESDWIENIPCWQILARATASGDLSEWNSQDTSGFNTDWASLERIYHQHNTGYGFD